MLAKRWQSGLMTATADDIETLSLWWTCLMPTGKERRSSPATSAHHHCPQTTHLPAFTMSLQVAAGVAVSRCCLHAMRPVWTSPPAARKWRSRPTINLYTGVKFWSFILTPRSGSTYMQVYTVREFSHKIGLPPCEENCLVRQPNYWRNSEQTRTMSMNIRVQTCINSSLKGLSRLANNSVSIPVTEGACAGKMQMYICIFVRILPIAASTAGHILTLNPNPS